jgi:alpha-galactosidase
MSWSITLIGKPENVAKALEAHSEKLNGLSKVEYDDALPHLIGLVKQNFGTSNLVKIDASGHGTENQRQCMVSIQNIYGVVV